MLITLLDSTVRVSLKCSFLNYFQNPKTSMGQHSIYSAGRSGLLHGQSCCMSFADDGIDLLIGQICKRLRCFSCDCLQAVDVPNMN